MTGPMRVVRTVCSGCGESMMQMLEEAESDGTMVGGFALTPSESVLSAKTQMWMSFALHPDTHTCHALCEDCGSTLFHKLRMGNPRQPQRCGQCGENITGDEHVRVTSLVLREPVTDADGDLAIEADEEPLTRDGIPDGYMCVDCTLLVVSTDNMAEMFDITK